MRRVCIAEGYTLGDGRRPDSSPSSSDFTQARWSAKFADYPQALANTLLIAKRCNLEMTLGTNYLPNFPLPEGVTIETHICTTR